MMYDFDFENDEFENDIEGLDIDDMKMLDEVLDGLEEPDNDEVEKLEEEMNIDSDFEEDTPDDVSEEDTSTEEVVYNDPTGDVYEEHFSKEDNGQLFFQF